MADPTNGEVEADERLLVVSVDSHVSPSIESYRPYCARADLEAFDDYAQDVIANPLTFLYSNSDPSERTRRYFDRILNEYGGDELNADPSARLTSLNSDGVAAEVVFHGAFGRHPIPFFSHSVADTLSQDVPVAADEQRLRAAGVRMYNRWLADWCATDPKRLIGVGHIPMWDILATVAEIRDAHAHGLRCINLPAPRRGMLGYNQPDWDPVWSACSELGMSLHTHGGGGDIFPASGPGVIGMLLAEVTFAGRRGVWQMIFGGVFERFPQLRFFVTEQNGAWVADLLQTMDSAYLSPMQRRESPSIREMLPRLPSEYFLSNCVVGASFMSRMESQAAFHGGYWTATAWGRDYPHAEGTWPFTQASLATTFAGLPRDMVAGVLGEIALPALDLDEHSLRSTAARIGPRWTSIDAHPSEVPNGSDLSFAFRSVGPFA